MQRAFQGKYLEVSTAGERVRAFVPASRPPRPGIDWTPTLRGTFDQALHALGQLAALSPPRAAGKIGGPRPAPARQLAPHGVLAAHARGRAETVATACPPRSAVAADRGMAPPVTGSLRLPDGDSTPPSSDNRS